MKKNISIAITLSALVFISSCSSIMGRGGKQEDPQENQKAEDLETTQETRVVPRKADGPAMFTRLMYENVEEDADAVQLYVSRNINFKRKTKIDSTLSIDAGELIENSGDSTTDFLIKAGTKVVAGVNSSNPDLLAINTGDKIVRFANFRLQEDGETDTYPNTAGGVYLPEACMHEGSDEDNVQNIGGVEYVLTTPCNSVLAVTARHVYDKDRNVTEATGKEYKIYGDDGGAYDDNEVMMGEVEVEVARPNSSR